MTTGQQRAAARLQAIEDANAIRYAGLADTPTRQQRRAHHRMMLAREAKAQKKADHMTARRALSKRKRPARERGEPRGLGWIGHLHSYARSMAGLKMALGLRLGRK